MSEELKSLLEVKSEKPEPELFIGTASIVFDNPALTGIPICQYCGKPAKKVGGEAIYPHRDDLFDQEFWQCKPCEAYTGVHPSGQLKGNLANRRLRGLRIEAHRAFDPMWEAGDVTRPNAYRWLTIQLNMDHEAHIGFLSEEQCKEVVRVCTTRRHPSRTSSK